MRALRPLEIVLVVSLGGSLLAILVPGFVRNLHFSRLAEPLEGLQRLGLAANEYAAGKPVDHAYPGDAPLTPEVVPRGEAVLDAPGIWDHPTWKALGFEFSHPHCFSFSFDAQNKADESTFRAHAYGDLDGDGIYSHFELTGRALAGKEPVIYPIDIEREVE